MAERGGRRRKFPARSSRVSPFLPVVRFASLPLPFRSFRPHLQLPHTPTHPTTMSTEHDYNVPSHPVSHRNSVEGSGHVAHANTEQYEKMYKESIQDPTAFWDKVRSSSTL